MILFNPNFNEYFPTGPELTIRVSGVLIENVLPIIFFFANLRLVFLVFSSGTDEVRAKRDPSLCNESVNRHFWSNLCLNCIFKWTWFVKTDIWSVIDRSRVRFPVEAALIFFSFSPVFLYFLTRFPFCSTRISKVGKRAAFQLWTHTYFFV